MTGEVIGQYIRGKGASAAAFLLFVGMLNAASASRLLRKRGGNSVVECDLAKVDVVGSNPIRRSILLRSIVFTIELRRNRFYEAIPAMYG